MATAVEEKEKTTDKTPRKATAATAKAPGKQRGRKKGSQLTDEQKQKLARGREIAGKVQEYLAAVETRPTKKRGRKVSRETLEAKLRDVEFALQDAKPLRRLKLLQEQMNLQAQLAEPDENAVQEDISALEAEFVSIAKEFAQNSGVSRRAFIQFGVPSDVLKKAGI